LGSLPKPSIKLASDLAAELRAELPRTVERAALGTPSKLPLKLVTLREALLFRLVDLADATVSASTGGLALGAAVLVRAVIETTAMLYAVGDLVATVVQRRSVEGVDLSIMQMLFGSKNKMTRQEASSILNRIDKMDRSFKGLRQQYENLSELVHPNFLGVVGSYSMVDKDRLYFGPSERMSTLVPVVVVPVLCFCLHASQLQHAKISAAFQDFCSVCHSRGVHYGD
jgi:hypothetical protein